MLSTSQPSDQYDEEATGAEAAPAPAQINESK